LPRRASSIGVGGPDAGRQSTQALTFGILTAVGGASERRSANSCINDAIPPISVKLVSISGDKIFHDCA